MSTSLATRPARKPLRRVPAQHCHAHNEVANHTHDAISAAMCSCYNPTPDDVCAAFTLLEAVLAAKLDKGGLPAVKQSICERHATTLSQALAVFHSQS